MVTTSASGEMLFVCGEPMQFDLDGQVVTCMQGTIILGEKHSYWVGREHACRELVILVDGSPDMEDTASAPPARPSA